MLAFVALHFEQWHLPSVIVAVVAAAVLALLRRIRGLPASMLVVVLAIGFARMLRLPSHGVAAVGTIEPPTLHLAVPSLSPANWLRAAELAFGLVIVFAESWGSMRSLALARGEELDANRELFALGACNLASA